MSIAAAEPDQRAVAAAPEPRVPEAPPALLAADEEDAPIEARFEAVLAIFTYASTPE